MTFLGDTPIKSSLRCHSTTPKATMRVLILLVTLFCIICSADARKLRQGGKPGGHPRIGKPHQGAGKPRSDNRLQKKIDELQELEVELEKIQDEAYWQEQEALRKEKELRAQLRQGKRLAARNGHHHGRKGGP